MKKGKYDLGGEKTMITEHLQNNAFKYNIVAWCQYTRKSYNKQCGAWWSDTKIEARPV